MTSRYRQKCCISYPVAQQYVPAYTPPCCPQPANTDPRRISQAYCPPTRSFSEPLSHAEYLRRLKSNNTAPLSSTNALVQYGEGEYRKTIWTETKSGGACCPGGGVAMPAVPAAQTKIDEGLRTETKGAKAAAIIGLNDEQGVPESLHTLQRQGQAIFAQDCPGVSCREVATTDIIPIPSPPSGLPVISLWFDPSDSQNVSVNGGNLQTFTDKSGNSNNGTAFRTAYNVSAINGLQTVRFVGSNNDINTAQYIKVTNSDFNDATITYAMVLKWNSGNGGFLATDEPGFYGRGVGVSGGDIQVIYNNNFEVMSPAFPLTAGQAIVLLVQFSNGPNNDLTPGELRISVNGTIQVYSRNQDAPDNNSGLNFGVWNPSNTQTINFDMGEVLVYTSQLTTLERQKVEGYLAWKWGLQESLPVGHPYKNAAP